MSYRLGQLSGPARLAILGFVLLLLGFQLAAQANLWVQDGEGALPGPHEVLVKYHGSVEASRLHRVLDPAVDASSPRAMWLYLDPTGDAQEIDRRRRVILDWVEAGASDAGWSDAQRVIHREAACLQCHAFGMEKQDLPLETLDQVRVVARKGGGMPLGPLLVSAHNHAFAFAVMALLLGLGVAGTGLGRGVKAALILGAFLGAALDVGGWFLTRSFGTPFHLGVVLGGGLFGLATVGMSLAILIEVLRGTGRPS